MPADAEAPTPDGPTERLRGRLCRERVDAGSKSERVALLLALTGGGRVALRRAGANPFRDPELEALEGQVLIVEGERRERYFLVRHYRVGDDDDGASG
ncbi:hypothetical protein ACQ86G_10375 [Roseateles chitinivorans]|uniref:hypothetical protein n=1 Tax=Roseateles chitinivorans TaxID=2917965 RepID=UPI003D67B60D